jgi:hypothetical protein
MLGLSLLGKHLGPKPNGVSEMFRTTEIRRALAKRDTKRLRELLNGTVNDEKNARELLRLIRHTGCLIDVYGGYREADWLKALIEVLTDALSGRPLNVLSSLIGEALIITLIFRHIKDAVKTLDVSALPPAQQAWAVIAWASSHVEIIHERSLVPPKQVPLLARAGANTLDAGDGRTFDVDSILAGTEQFLRMTLSMLAYENGWWDQQGKLAIPQDAVPPEVDVDVAGSHIYLASIWDLVLSASETLRFWGESVDMASVSTDDATEEKSTQIKFNLHLDTHLYFEIARLRVMQIEIDTHMYSLGLPEPDYGDMDAETISLPPNDFISFDELSTHVTLDMLYHLDLGEGTKINGLNPAVLTRGYAVLRRCYAQEFGQADLSLVEIDQPRLVQALRNCSLSDSEIKAFLATATFGRDSKDLFDCPIIASDNGKLYLLRSLSQFASLPRVIVSRLTSLRSKFENKGPRFELEVIDEFVENGVPAKGFTFTIGAEEYQFDCVVLWDDYVFVLECKNYLLPSESAAQEFYFMEAMDDATRQVQRLTSALQENPEKLLEQFEAVPEDLTFVPVILNAMPFSTDEQRNGVYMYDYSALNRFFEGKISVNQPIKTDEGWIRVEHVVKKLWEGPSPTAIDLISQMTMPVQLAGEFPRWHEQGLVVGLSGNISMILPILQKEATSSKDMFKAIGVSDEVADRMLELGNEIHSKLTGSSRSEMPDKDESSLTDL